MLDPTKELRDQRELLRTRMALRDLRSCVKRGFCGALEHYGLHVDEVSDLFGKTGREYLKARVAQLPKETGRIVVTQLSRAAARARHACVIHRWTSGTAF